MCWQLVVLNNSPSEKRPFIESDCACFSKYWNSSFLRSLTFYLPISFLPYSSDRGLHVCFLCSRNAGWDSTVILPISRLFLPKLFFSRPVTSTSGCFLFLTGRRFQGELPLTWLHHMISDTIGRFKENFSPVKHSPMSKTSLVGPRVLWGRCVITLTDCENERRQWLIDWARFNVPPNTL